MEIDELKKQKLLQTMRWGTDLALSKGKMHATEGKAKCNLWHKEKLTVLAEQKNEESKWNSKKVTEPLSTRKQGRQSDDIVR